MKKMRNILRHWLPLAGVATALCGLVYVAVQQVLRQNADDPQIQMAQDTANALAGGATLESVVPTAEIDVSRNLAPFLIVYNQQGVAMASSGLLHGETPQLPPGVLDFAGNNGEDRVTWQPEPGVRIAAVVVPILESTKGGFALAGRSLREVEARESQVVMEAGAALIATLVATLAVVVFCELVLAAE